MNHKDFRKLADMRLDEARSLATAKKWNGAYYLAGYSVECAVKSCIAKSIRAGVIPERNFEKNFYSHDLNSLAKFAGLISNDILLTGPNFVGQARTLELNWSIAKTWKETARYATWPRKQAIELIRAIEEPKDGVMEWLQQHW
jgi:HEPN domain-containing protein